MRVGYIILDVSAEAGIDENWWLLENKSMCNSFINGKYLSNTIDSPDEKYIYVYILIQVWHTQIRLVNLLDTQIRFSTIPGGIQHPITRISADVPHGDI